MAKLNLPTLSSMKRRRGATALEYALVLAFVAVAVLAAMNLLSTNLSNSIGTVGTKVTSAVNDDFK